MTLWSYSVTYVSTTTNITTYVSNIEDISLTTNGEVRSAEIILKARDGAFLTQSNSGATPILAEWDKISITLTDRNSNTETHVFEVASLRPIKDSSGPKVVVGLLGQERHLQKIPYQKSWQRASAYTVIKDIIDVYNDNKGSAQAIIEKHDDATFNTAPKYTSNDYDFSDSPSCLEAIRRVIDRLGASVANGGAGDFFDVFFIDKSGDTATLQIKVLSSGGLPASPITVQNALTTPVRVTNGTLENKTGTVIIGLGANGFGSLPADFAEHWGKLESFLLIPDHISGVTYPSGARVKLNGTYYQANTSTSQTPPHANWSTIKAADVIGAVSYSPWTFKKAALWENCGSNPTGNEGGSGTGFDQEGMWDGNLVVRDENQYRNWVHLRTNTSAYDTNWKYGNAAAGAYRGFRILVDPQIGTLAGAFAQNSGNDRFGKAYSKSLVRHNGGTETGATEYKNWDVIRLAADGDVCAVINLGKNFIFSSSNWTDDSATARGNDCFHIYNSIANGTGISSTSKQKGDTTWIDLDGAGGGDTGENYGADHAVTVTWDYTPFSTVTSSLFTGTNFYSIGAWLNLMFPFPPNIKNSITENLGQLYGGTSSTKIPASFDAAGFFGLTPTGQSGWNKTDSEELGTIDSIDFMMKFRWEDQGTSTPIALSGNFKMRCVIYDDSDNVVYQDFEILDNDRWESISLPLTGFKPYRARAPLRWGNVITNLIVPELEVLEKFEWTNVRLACFQLQEVYDKEGRYSPEGSRFVTALPIGSTKRITLSIDAFRFSKQLVVTSGQDTTRCIIPDFVNVPDVTNYQQLTQIVQAQKDIEQHQYKAWEVTQEGRNDISQGQSFYLTDAKLVGDSDNGANTIKLVAREIHYSINGTDGGQGGYTRTILGVKRI